MGKRIRFLLKLFFFSTIWTVILFEVVLGVDNIGLDWLIGIFISSLFVSMLLVNHYYAAMVKRFEELGIEGFQYSPYRKPLFFFLSSQQKEAVKLDGEIPYIKFKMRVSWLVFLLNMMYIALR